MQTQMNNQTIEVRNTTIRFRRPSPILQLAEVRERHRKIRLGCRAPRREVCLTKRAMIAALREAELADWLASGGDYLNSMHQPVN